jgi:pilus assembly protein CpaF
MSNWLGVQDTVGAAELDQLVDAAVRDLAGLPLRVRFRRKELGNLAGQTVRKLVSQRGLTGRLSPTQVEALIGRTVALVGGFGFLEGLIPPRCNDYTDLTVNADGVVRGRRKGARTFERLNIPASSGQAEEQERWRAEVWRTVEALLTPQQRACTEATPTVDIKIPRDREIGFGGARVKVIHPCLAPGDGFPVLAVRLFEPEPVRPDQIVGWGVFPEPVLAKLMECVGQRLRLIIAGGTGTGKTTLLSAICHGIPLEARVVKIEDPEEIWLAHDDVVTLEARPAPPGSEVPSYNVADGVDDAMRMAPAWLIVGEVRTGPAALTLFRGLMSDHPGLTTFHAEGPEAVVHRMSVLMFTDCGVKFEAAKAMFGEAIDLVIQIGWREGRRRALGIWEVAGMSSGDVKFRQLWRPDDEEMAAPTRRRD